MQRYLDGKAIAFIPRELRKYCGQSVEFVLKRDFDAWRGFTVRCGCLEEVYRGNLLVSGKWMHKSEFLALATMPRITESADSME